MLTNLPQAGFEIGSLGQQAGMPPIQPHLLVYVYAYAYAYAYAPDTILVSVAYTYASY